jgi:UTP--glucose-1-phosphate uridylyltransferase
MKIRKAVLSAAGLGTRFLPATKAMPKEMLPIVDKPLIQYSVEECVNSGIEDIIIITGRGKYAIEDHFDVSYELEKILEKREKLKYLKKVQAISNLINLIYTRQKEALGVGHAVLMAKNLVGHEPFAVLFADDIIDAEIPCLKQMISIFNKYGSSVIAIQQVAKEEVDKYGIIKAKKIEERLYDVEDLIEKPPRAEAPSNLAIIGRYLLTPEIFAELEETKVDHTGEIQLTNGLKGLLKSQRIFAYQFQGTRYDAGNKLGFLQATVELALKNNDFGEQFRTYLKSLKL